MIEVLHKETNTRLDLRLVKDMLADGELLRLASVLNGRVQASGQGEVKISRTKPTDDTPVKITFKLTDKLGRAYAEASATDVDYVSFDGRQFPVFITAQEFEAHCVVIEGTQDFHVYRSIPVEVSACLYEGDGDNLLRPAQKAMLAQLKNRGLIADSHNDGIAILGRVRPADAQDEIFKAPIILHPGQYVVFLQDVSLVQVYDEAEFRVLFQ